MWSLEQIKLQASRGGVNRQQAQQLVDEIRQLHAALHSLSEAALLVCHDFRHQDDPNVEELRYRLAQVAQARGDDPLKVFRGEP
jgi:hypothetical protein